MIKMQFHLVHFYLKAGNIKLQIMKFEIIFSIPILESNFWPNFGARRLKYTYYELAILCRIYSDVDSNFVA